MNRSIKRILLVAGAALMLALPVRAQQGTTAKSPEKPPVVVAASATSYGEGASSIVCLLDPQCDGFWMPQSRDGGVNEGIYIQFREPFEIRGLDIVMEGDTSRTVMLKPYFDGMTGADASAQKYRRAKAQQEEEMMQREIREAERDIEKPDYDGPGDLPWQPDQWGSVDGDQIGASPDVDEASNRTHFIVYHHRKNYRIRSIFLKIDAAFGGRPPKIRAIRFYDKTLVGEIVNVRKNPDCRSDCETLKHFQIDAGLLPLELPVSVKAAVSATSVLSPEIAYGPEHLFDSQADMAWSTEGAKTGGINESVTVDFSNRQDIQGLMIWNGYQRSEAHYKANGRIRTLQINGETVSVKDEPGIQTLRLQKPISADRVTLSVKEIYKGAAYKDVLVSELRFLTPAGRIILPEVERKSAKLPEPVAELQDSTYASFIQNVYQGQDSHSHHYYDWYFKTRCSGTSLRVRSNGSFVIYADFLDGAKVAGSYRPGVIEGNWEPGKDDRSLGLFGKKYAVPVSEASGYLTMSEQMRAMPGPRIFRSMLKISRFNELPEAEQKSVLNFLLSRRQDEAKGGKVPATTIWLNLAGSDLLKDLNKTDGGDAVISGRTFDEAMGMLQELVRKLDPLFVKSDVYTDLLLPQEKTIKCQY